MWFKDVDDFSVKYLLSNSTTIENASDWFPFISINQTQFSRKRLKSFYKQKK